MKVSWRKRSAGKKATPRRSLRKYDPIALSDMLFALRSMKRLLGEDVSGGTQPTNGLLVRDDLVFFQEKMVNEPSGLTNYNGTFVGIILIGEVEGRGGC